MVLIGLMILEVTEGFRAGEMWEMWEMWGMWELCVNEVVIWPGLAVLKVFVNID